MNWSRAAMTENFSHANTDRVVDLYCTESTARMQIVFKANPKSFSDNNNSSIVVEKRLFDIDNK